jgi:hypothetical protein
MTRVPSWLMPTFLKMGPAAAERGAMPAGSGLRCVYTLCIRSSRSPKPQVGLRNAALQYEDFMG